MRNLGLIVFVFSWFLMDSYDSTGREERDDTGFLRPVVSTGCYKITDIEKNRSWTHSIAGTYGQSRSPEGEDRFFVKALFGGGFLIGNKSGEYLEPGNQGLLKANRLPSSNSEWDLQERDSDTFYVVHRNTGKAIGSMAFNRLGVTHSESKKLTLRFVDDGDPCFDTRNEEPTLAYEALQDVPVDVDQVVGYVDLHSHLFTHVGFNGNVISGSPFHKYGIRSALDSCHHEHGIGGLLDFSGSVQREKVAHSTQGFPEFREWPNWDGYSHQIAYYKWLERAFKSGLKIVNMLATNNSVVCGLSSGDLDCSDMAAVDRQLAAAKQLVEFIDWEAGGIGEGWLQIATSPAEARKLIANQKMVLVLGIEVPGIFDCNEGFCDEATVDRELDRYYEQGVRYVFPIHGFNNAFGGTALFTNFYNIGNKVVNGSFFDVVPCDESGFGLSDINFDANFDTLQRVTSALFTKSDEVPDYPDTGRGHCNKKGLTELGDYFIRALIKRGMFIDIDHMSARMVDDVMAIAEELNYPLMSSHAGVVEMSLKSNEHQRSRDQIASLRDLGGMMAPISNQRIFNTNWAAEDDCPGSTKAFSSVFSFVKSVYEENGQPVAVGFSSDANGYAKATSPRFSDDACNGLGGQQSDPVAYPFDSYDGSGRFFSLTTGDRLFDFNQEGLAHIGLLPEFVEDMGNAGMNEEDLKDFFSSAEQFLRIWEKQNS
ncbi:MAG: membrane dipeptidase [Pseudobacteriovorax sp.]|nr:membrane dipeptidase [Pseudobacteriovorax sp.]